MIRRGVLAALFVPLACGQTLIQAEDACALLASVPANRPCSSSLPVPTTRPEGVPDTLTHAIGELKGRTLRIDSPQQFAKAIREIERAGR
jgi:hypothetical protein